MFIFYMRRIVKSRLFYLCIVISAISLIHGCSKDLPSARDNIISVMYLLRVSEGAGLIVVTAPVLMSVSFLFFFVEELDTKMVYYQMLRTNRVRYFRGQILSAVVSAGLIALISTVVFGVVCTLAGGSWTEMGDFSWLNAPCLEAIVFSAHLWKISVWYCVLLIMYCLPWALIGMIVSLFTKNRYILIASPFIVFMAWNYLTQLAYPYFYNILFVLPTEPLMGGGLMADERWTLGLTIVYPVIYHAILIGGLSLAYYFVTKRRFCREGI